MTAAFVLGTVFLGKVFFLVPLSLPMMLLMMAISAAGILLLFLLARVMKNR